MEYIEVLFPEYNDVAINKETCYIRKIYNGKPCTYFCNEKSITVNLKWPEGKSGYCSSRSVNILAAYKKAFKVGFSGDIIARSTLGGDVCSYHIINGKIVDRTLIQTKKPEYFETPKHTSYSYVEVFSALGKQEYQSLYIR